MQQSQENSIDHLERVLSTYLYKKIGIHLSGAERHVMNWLADEREHPDTSEPFIAMFLEHIVKDDTKGIGLVGRTEKRYWALGLITPHAFVSKITTDTGEIIYEPSFKPQVHYNYPSWGIGSKSIPEQCAKLNWDAPGEIPANPFLEVRRH